MPIPPALGALQSRVGVNPMGIGAENNPLEFGEAYNDPTQKFVKRYVDRAGGDYNAAAKAAWNEREKKRQRTNMAGGSSLIQIENEARGGFLRPANDAQMLQTAVKLKNLAASGGKSQGPEAEAPRPQMGEQQRRQLASANMEAATRRGDALAKAQKFAMADAARARENQRMQVEGDAWAAEQKRKMLLAQQAAPQMSAVAPGAAAPTAVGTLATRR